MITFALKCAFQAVEVAGAVVETVIKVINPKNYH